MKKKRINTRTITLSAMFAAVGVILSFVRIPLSTVTEITLTGLPMAVGAYMLGPWPGFMIGGLIDLIGFMIAPKGAYFPGFTLSSALIGMIYGLLLYRKWWNKQDGRSSVLINGNKGLVLRIVIAHFIKTLSISLCLNCLWLSMFYGMSFTAVFIASLPKELINFPVEVFLIYLLIMSLKRTGNIEGGAA